MDGAGLYALCIVSYQRNCKRLVLILTVRPRASRIGSRSLLEYLTRSCRSSIDGSLTHSSFWHYYTLFLSLCTIFASTTWKSRSRVVSCSTGRASSLWYSKLGLRLPHSAQYGKSDDSSRAAVADRCRNLGYEFFKVTHLFAVVVFVLIFFWHCDYTLTSW